LVAIAPTSVGSELTRSPAAAAVPGWFGREDRPLFGWWHLPPGGLARGVVVMAPAMARERLAADFSWRTLARTLAEQGVAVLRFDYTATGDSSGTAADPGLAGQWREDIAVAVDAARSATSAPVVLLGHRLGGTLVADVVRAGVPVDGVLLWDPVPSGRRYLRELAAQQRIALPGEPPDADDGWLGVPGDDLGTATAEAVRRLDLLAGGPLPETPVLVLARPGSEPKLRPLLDRPGPGAIRPVPGQPELLDLDPITARPAAECLTAVAEWCREVLPERLQVVAPTLRPDVQLPGPAGTRPVVERATWLDRGAVFAVVAEPVDQPVRRTVLMLSAGVETHPGPARMWVALARAWAEQGLRVVRCDLPGLGESPARPGATAHRVYEPSTIDDVEVLLRELDPTDPARVTLVGMCSGAYGALEAAARVGSRQLVLIAFGWWLVPAEFRRGRAIDHRRRCYRSALGALRPVMTVGRGRRFLLDHPETLWRTATRLRLTAPLRPFRRLVRAGGRITLVLGETDHAHFAPLGRQLQRLSRQRSGRSGSRGSFELHVEPQLDHGLLNGAPRRDVARLVLDRVLDPVLDEDGRP
jgi:alpha-beta hydrolase superfamily lysophospholipase